MRIIPSFRIPARKPECCFQTFSAQLQGMVANKLGSKPLFSKNRPKHPPWSPPPRHIWNGECFNNSAFNVWLFGDATLNKGCPLLSLAPVVFYVHAVAERHAPAPGGREQAGAWLAHVPGAWRASWGVACILGAWRTACGGVEPSTGRRQPQWHPTMITLLGAVRSRLPIFLHQCVHVLW